MQKPGELEKRASGVAIAAPPLTSQLPVTLLSGFLGAGKTTLLKRILQGTHGLKIAVIVNDMAELNIDGALISKSGGQLVQTEQKLVQMQNGCICCTLREDLLEEVAKLANDGSFDYCVIESTGISEPMQVAETFSLELPEAGGEEGGGGTPGKPAAAAAAADAASHGGKRAKRSEVAFPSSSSDSCSDLANNTTSMIPSTLAGVARLDTCLTVVDASKFWDDLQSIEELADRHPDKMPEGDDRNIAALLIDQIEFADVLILNKCDVVSKGQVKAIRALLARLNPIARILQCVRAQVPLKEVMNTGLFDLEKASRAPGWIQAIDRANKELRVSKIVSEKDEYGVASFVYTARRPFHPGRLYRDFLRRFFLSQVVDTGDEDGEVNNGSGSSSSSSSCSSDEEEGGGEQAGGAGCKKEELSKYQAARDEVLAAAKAQLGGLMRSKGFFWLATQPKHVLGWSSAGALLQVTREGPWFACVPKEHWPGDEEVVARIAADFCTERPEVGDRRQELVFIGQDLKEAAIRMALDACLASDEEVALAAEGQLRDELFGGDEEEGGD